MATDKQQSLSANLEQRPFLGLRSFDEDNKSQFGGRDQEVEELFELIEENALTVVFGKSGIGKTSLLRAGLMPELRKQFYFPIYIRIDYNKDQPLAVLKESLYETLHDKDPDVEPLNGRSLWEYFHDMNFSQGLVQPVLILDQFEEIFTLGENNPGVKKLLNELSNLAENRIPVSVQNRYKKLGETVPTRYSNQTYRVVFSLREDFLPQLEEVRTSIPSIMDNRFRVVQMTISQAMEAAIKPGKGLVDKEVARAIIAKLPGISESDFETVKYKGHERANYKVEPFLLSFICDRMNEERIAQGIKTFTPKLVKNFEVEDAIRSFYNETLGQYPNLVEHGIEDLLLTEGGFRKLQALGELQSKYEISDDVIDELIQARILRKENRDNVDYVELIHDVLTGVIKEKRDKRLEEEKELARLEAIKLERAKNRRRYKRVGSILAVILIGLIIVSIVNSAEVRENKAQKERKARSRDLLLSAISLSIYTDDNEDKGFSALLSRLAYGLYAQDREEIPGINEVDWKFYQGLVKSNYYEEIKRLGDNSAAHSTFRLKIPSNSETENADHNKKTNDVAGSNNNVIHNMTPTHLIRIDHQNAYLVAFRDSTIRKVTLNTSSINLVKKQVFQYLADNSAGRVSAMAYDSVRQRLAIAQNRTIYLYDKDNSQHQQSIQIPDSSRKSYTSSFLMRFMPDGSLVLSLGAKLYRWDTTYTIPVLWNEIISKKWRILDGEDLTIIEVDDLFKPIADTTLKGDMDLTRVKTDSQVVKTNNAQKAKRKKKSNSNTEWELEISPSEKSLAFTSKSKRRIKIKALSVSKDSLIALGIQDKLIIIDKNVVHEIAFSKWKEITALSFDPTGKYIVLGDRFGVVYQMEIPSDHNFQEFALTKHIAHSKRILDISFSPKDSTIFATASQDGSVAIWNKNPSKKKDNSILRSFWNKNNDEKEVWSALVLDSSIFGFSGAAIKISFSAKGGHLLVTYEDGNIIKWPSSLEKINKMICQKLERKRKDLEKDLSQRILERKRMDLEKDSLQRVKDASGNVEDLSIKLKDAKDFGKDLSQKVKDAKGIVEADKRIYCCNCKK